MKQIMVKIWILFLLLFFVFSCGNRLRKFIDQPSEVADQGEIKKAIDPVYPETKVTCPPNYDPNDPNDCKTYYNYDITIQFYCSYNGSPCDSNYAQYARSDGISPTLANQVTSLFLSTTPGTRTVYTVRFFSARKDGTNQEVVRSKTIIIDKEPPVITNVFPPTNTGYLTIQNVEILMNETGTIYYTLNDPNDGLPDVDPQTLDPATDISTLCPLPEAGKMCPYSSKIPLTQSTNILYYAVDTAGNKSATGLAAYTINTTGNDIGSTADVNLKYESLNTSVTIKMTKNNLQALVVNGYDMKVMDLDMSPVMDAALDKIRTQTFTPGTPEQNMQNLLNMSAASADLSGTMLEDLISLTNYMGLEGGATGFLALTMNKGPTQEGDPLLSTSQINDTMSTNVLGIHYGTNNTRYFSGLYDATGLPIDYTDGKIWDFNFNTKSYCKRPWKHSCEDPAGAEEYPSESMPASGTFPIFLSDALSNMANLAKDKTGMPRFASGGAQNGQAYAGFMCSPPLHPLVVQGNSRGDGNSDAICLTCGSGTDRCEPTCGPLGNEPCAPQNCVYDPAWPPAPDSVFCYNCGPDKKQPCPYSNVMLDTMYITIPATVTEDIRKGYDFTDLKIGNIDQVTSSAFNLDTTQIGMYGLVENATVDMIFTMDESTTFFDLVPSGEYTRNTGAAQGGNHIGYSNVWKNQASGGLFPENRFRVEYVVAYGAYKAVKDFTFPGSDYDYRSDPCTDSGFSGSGPYNFSTAVRCYDDPGSVYTDPFRKYSGDALHKQYHNGDHSYKLAEIWQRFPAITYYSNNAKYISGGVTQYGCNVTVGGEGPWIHLWTVVYNNPPGGWFIDGQGGTSLTCHDPQLIGFYLHDLITVVAQKRLHDGGLAEGAGNVRFKLEDVPVGLTADDMKQAIRDTLNSPNGKQALLDVATVLFAGQNNGIPDIFIDKDNTATPTYYLCMNADPSTKENRSDNSVTYVNVGFYRNDFTYPAFDPSADFVSSNKKSQVYSYISAKGGANANECVIISSTGGEVYWVQVEDGTDGNTDPDVYKIEMLPSSPGEANFRWTRVY